MKYKIGDKVRVKTWEEMLKVGELNAFGSIVLYSKDGYSESFTKNMKKHCNKIVEIARVNNKCYTIKEDIFYVFTDEMLELVETAKQSTKKKVNKISRSIQMWDSSAIKEQKKQAEFDERYSNLCEKLKRK